MNAEIKDVLRKARVYVQKAHDAADLAHDIDLDSVQYEIMQETEALLARIDALIK
jgi:hypothetical protein